MKKIGLFLIISIFVSVFANTSHAKSTYLNAGQADHIWYLDVSEYEEGKNFGLILEERYDEGKGEDVLRENGDADYYINTNKIKKLYIYGDSRGGSIIVELLKVNSQTGAFEWIAGNPEQIEPTALDFSSGKVTLVDSTIKKSKNEKWVLMITMEKGEVEGAESPIVYGIKYKS